MKQDPRYVRVDRGGGILESRYKLSGKAVVKERDGYSYVSLVTEIPSESTSDIPAGLGKLPRLDASATYDIEVLEAEYWKGRIERNLLTITDRNGRKIHDASLCPLHHVPMGRRMEKEKSIPEDAEAFWNDIKRFPNDGVAYLGCGSGYSHLQWVCPKCIEVSERWHKRHAKR